MVSFACAYRRPAMVTFFIWCMAFVLPASAQTDQPDPFAPLSIYEGEWAVQALHPWSGAATGATDRLQSRCHRYLRYFACEQSVEGESKSLIVYTASGAQGRLFTRNIATDGRAGARGELIIDGANWTYLDKPPPTLQEPWSKIVNVIVNRSHIHFEEYESTDQGKAWALVNSGEELRQE